MIKQQAIVICDFGSQYTLLIGRRFRELGFYTEVIDGRQSTPPNHLRIMGIVLSGGPDSVYEAGARPLPEWVLGANVPVLGICYGMQLLVQAFGGKVGQQKNHREYGRAQIHFQKSIGKHGRSFIQHLPDNPVMWMSHGDSAEDLGPKFELLGASSSTAVAAIVHKERPVIGLQFHPEVHHSEKGAILLDNFARHLCCLEPNWRAKDIVDSCLEAVRTQINPQDKVLMAVSGGVDSTVASVLIAKAIGNDRLQCVLVDHGLMRWQEREEVSRLFEDLRLHLHIIDAQQSFFERLKGLTDPESKRKTVGAGFIETFEAYAKEASGTYSHLAQGTLYPDVIESAGHGAGSLVIKSHHNVGGLPEKLHLKLLEPFRFLFKDEVRLIGRELGIPEHWLMRHPFPGPGLSVRIPGEVTRERVELLQKADHIFTSSLKEQGHYQKVWQAGAVLLPVKSVGVMGDNRTYQWACSLRAVQASDGMTAEASDLPISFLSGVADKIVRSVPGINRVLYDVTSKPPATIEWE